MIVRDVEEAKFLLAIERLISTEGKTKSNRQEKMQRENMREREISRAST